MSQHPSITSISLNKPSSTTTSKKKFGKNLSKLIKQPTPPPITGLNSRSIYRSNSGVSGTSSLVLLSTNKKKKSSVSSGISSISSSNVTGGNHDSHNNDVHNDNDVSSSLPVAWKVEEHSSQIQDQNDNHDNDDDMLNNDSKIESEYNTKDEKVDKEIPSTSPQTPPLVSTEVKTNDDEETKGDQVEFMKKLAKERAMKLRQEEENRIQEQKERAALRLKELEMKMAQKSTSTVHGQSKSDLGDQSYYNQYHQRQQPKRTLYDPHSTSSRTHSSLIGNDSNNNTTNHSMEYRSNNDDNRESSSSSIPYPNHHQPPPHSLSENIGTTMPMYNLSSYEDRDRGMVRNVNTGPRMLFDPKSGSMVAAPSRDDKTASGNKDRDRKVSNKGKKENVKSKGSKSRRDLDNGGTSSNESQGLEGGKGNKSRNTNKKDMRKNDDKSTNARGDGTRKITNSTTSRKNGKSNNKKSSLPRTNGVLYRRNEKGNLVSADGCEGDEGYGAHSVPGGRIRNPKGFAVHKRKLQSAGDRNKKMSADFGDQGYTRWNSQYDYGYDTAPSKTLNRSHFMRKSVSTKESTDGNNVDLSTPLLVTADEKLDLLTGIDDSPKLQATAAEWAPSKAALALAKAHASKKEKDISSMTGKNTAKLDAPTMDGLSLGQNKTPNEVDDDEDGYHGLGFDPTKDMDAVMMSPDFFGENISEGEMKNISDLVLRTSLSQNPFRSESLLGPSPWGGNIPNSVSMGSLTDWAYSRGAGKKDGSNDVSSGNMINDDLRTKSVLSLSGFNGDTNTWGNGGLRSSFTDGKTCGSDDSVDSND